MKYPLVDTRPYSKDKPRSRLALITEQVLLSATKPDREFAEKQLEEAIEKLLIEKQSLPITIAMSLSPSQEYYKVLLQALQTTLQAKQGESQWIALPLVILLGSSRTQSLDLEIPLDSLQPLLTKWYGFQASEVFWFNYLVPMDLLSGVKSEQWYEAKLKPAALVKWLQSYSPQVIQLQKGQQILLSFVLGYTVELALDKKNSEQALMEMMQFWTEYFLKQDLTPFVLPMPPSAVLKGMLEGGHMSKKVELDIFISEAIRSIKLLRLPVGAIIATKEGGSLEISLQSLDSPKKVFTYSWKLSFAESLDERVEELISLLTDCQVDQISLLKCPMEFQASIPDFATALKEQKLLLISPLSANAGN
ncbi:MAG: hypothetical protein WDW20_00315 [Neisseriaceae bacterium]